jgi:lipoprotein NlpI
VAYYNRGVSRFALGQFSSAAEDFEHCVKLEPSRAYGALWLHIVRAKTSQPDGDEFKRNISEFDLDKWPGPVGALYLGQATSEQVKHAAEQGSTKKTLGQSCEFDFYFGEYALLAGIKKRVNLVKERVFGPEWCV